MSEEDFIDVEIFYYFQAGDDVGSGGVVTDKHHMPLPDNVGRFFSVGLDFKSEEEKNQRILLVPVDSSNVTHIGWSIDDKQLYVLFKNGGFYRYLDVPYNSICALMNSISIGKYLSAHFKPDHECQNLLPG